MATGLKRYTIRPMSPINDQLVAELNGEICGLPLHTEFVFASEAEKLILRQQKEIETWKRSFWNAEKELNCELGLDDGVRQCQVEIAKCDANLAELGKRIG